MVQAGSDSTGVATDMVSMNSTVKLTFRNTATFFGVHVTSTPLDLSYSKITVASGTVSYSQNAPSFSPFFPPINVKFNSDPNLLILSSLVILQIKKFYQSRKSHRSLTIVAMGDTIPLYGSGASLSTSTGTTTEPVPLKLSFMVRSRAYVLGKLVKPKFYKRIECSVTLDPKKLNTPISLKKSCTYQ